MKRSTLIASAAAVALIGTAAWAESDQYAYAGHMMGGYGHGLFGGIMMLLFWGGAIAIAILAIRRLGQNNGSNTRPSAFDILQERLAKGDIDADEYRVLKTALGG